MLNSRKKNKYETPRRKISQEREFESYHKRFQDFEIGPNISETQFCPGTILYP